ncbi:MAG: helix-turn-helix transcriptional regulator [Flavobacteriales bacterium]|nr:helix-turn-helix transcriptional regulator [Flavobacteriales bacterium]
MKNNVLKVLKKIKECRKLKGLSNENMAYELEISTSTYNKIERGEVSLTLERFYKISEILDVTVSELLELNFDNQFNQIIRDNSSGQLFKNQQIENYYQENKDVYEKLLKSKDEQIEFLKKIIEKNNFL